MPGKSLYGPFLGAGKPTKAAAPTGASGGRSTPPLVASLQVQAPTGAVACPSAGGRGMAEWRSGGFCIAPRRVAPEGAWI
jgi:hypothetical protein